MSIYREKRFLPYTPAQLFELVAAVDQYPKFLPWCLAARIRSTETLEGTPQKALMMADLVIGFRMIRERYMSRVTLQPPQRIDVKHVKGPFRYLNNHWIFEPVASSAKRPAGGTMLTFHIEFEFRSMLLQSLMSVLFDDAARRMVAAFEARAKRLYGPRRSGATGLHELSRRQVRPSDVDRLARDSRSLAMPAGRGERKEYSEAGPW
jgi:coenzyme Q-binding protein COQ10